jgi:hypothetical protein
MANKDKDAYHSSTAIACVASLFDAGLEVALAGAHQGLGRRISYAGIPLFRITVRGTFKLEGPRNVSSTTTTPLDQNTLSLQGLDEFVSLNVLLQTLAPTSHLTPITTHVTVPDLRWVSFEGFSTASELPLFIVID